MGLYHNNAYTAPGGSPGPFSQALATLPVAFTPVVSPVPTRVYDAVGTDRVGPYGTGALAYPQSPNYWPLGRSFYATDGMKPEVSPYAS